MTAEAFDPQRSYDMEPRFFVPFSALEMEVEYDPGNEALIAYANREAANEPQYEADAARFAGERTALLGEVEALIEARPYFKLLLQRRLILDIRLAGSLTEEDYADAFQQVDLINEVVSDFDVLMEKVDINLDTEKEARKQSDAYRKLHRKLASLHGDEGR
jgi:hypothetical protein